MNTPKSRLDRMLAAIERGGNALPHPATLFAIWLTLGIPVGPDSPLTYPAAD